MHYQRMFLFIATLCFFTTLLFRWYSLISYMFLALFINPLLCLFHIIIHALFKSILSLLAGSMIHIQYNYQSIYKIKINHSFIFIIFLLVGSVLIISLSKEIMIQSFNYIIIASFSWIILCIGGVSTILYTLKIYIHCFYFCDCDFWIISEFIRLIKIFELILTGFILHGRLP